MFPTTRLKVIAGVLIMLAVHSCQPKPPVEKELLPAPGAKIPVTSRVIRPVLDKSPMDMIYYPADYPIAKMTGKADSLPVARVIYSRPEKDGRVIFGNLVKYGEYWRLGANEATEIEFFRDVTIMDKRIRKGRYILYCIPYAEKWKIILNGDLFVWGLKIHASRDLYSFEIPTSPSRDIYEVLTMEFAPRKNGMQLMMAWDAVKASLPIRY